MERSKFQVQPVAKSVYISSRKEEITVDEIWYISDVILSITFYTSTSSSYTEKNWIMSITHHKNIISRKTSFSFFRRKAHHVGSIEYCSLHSSCTKTKTSRAIGARRRRRRKRREKLKKENRTWSPLIDLYLLNNIGTSDHMLAIWNFNLLYTQLFRWLSSFSLFPVSTTNMFIVANSRAMHNMMHARSPTAKPDSRIHNLLALKNLRNIQKNVFQCLFKATEDGLLLDGADMRRIKSCYTKETTKAKKNFKSMKLSGATKYKTNSEEPAVLVAAQIFSSCINHRH